ncbi:MAG: peroxiredoxin [Candidatus Thermoplasmatota archaeon]|jgi:peroxiredoxin Q/BCP|uniref:peroxiredoxin n=1 Tax=Ferroplasma sp. TaxID=2591003 RepID=UPI0026393168|nr:peroxiredoxin [Ferroplasma sp.]MCL4312283.1 peroxiredoxin [Candidatus Thermoplasmatota archaeon]
METLNVGDHAPDFETLDQDGKIVKLADFKDKVVVLYFYPKDNTPGCTMEAKNFRDNIDMFKEKEIAVLGVSVDSSESHKKFQEKLGLNFTLLSDRPKEIVKKYGVLGLATAKRVTYIIKDGKIVYVYPKVSPREHAKEVYEKIEELKLV